MSFLQPLGAGWLAVSFFMYLMFFTKHIGPIPTFDTLAVYFTNGSVLEVAVIIFAMLWILIFLVIHLYTLVKHLKSFFLFKKTKEFSEFKETNSEITLISLPLTLAMMMNVLFIVLVVFVPWFWNVVEFAFPFALLWFLIIGIYALRIYGIYFAKRIHKWWLDVDNNNSLSQMIAVFAFSMIWVWFAWPAAMSQTSAISWIAMFLSILFLVVAFVLLIIKIVIGFQSMFAKWINKIASPSLWIMIPILTLFGISLVRHNSALEHSFNVDMVWIKMFILTSIIISAQLFFWYLWYIVMRKNNYFKDYVLWDKKDIWSFSLICPGVALFVFGMFFINKWLVFSWLVDKFSLVYFLLFIPLLFVQFVTIKALIKLSKKNK